MDNGLFWFACLLGLSVHLTVFFFKLFGTLMQNTSPSAVWQRGIPRAVNLSIGIGVINVIICFSRLGAL